MQKGIALAALSGILYGCLGYFGHDLSVHGLSITEICLWRFVFGSFCFLPLLPFMFKQKIALRDLLFPFVLGSICYSTSAYFYFMACPYIGSGLAMIIFFTYPILVVLISSFLHKKRPTGISLLSSFLILVGCSLIAYQKSIKLDPYGITLSLIAAFGYGFYVALSKNKGVKPLPPLISTFCVCLGNVLAFAILLVCTQDHYSFPSDPYVLRQLTLFGIFGTFLPVLLLLYSLKYISSNTAAIISVFEPLTSLSVGFFILKESVSLIQFSGALIILSAAMLTSLFTKEEAVEDLSPLNPSDEQLSSGSKAL